MTEDTVRDLSSPVQDLRGRGVPMNFGRRYVAIAGELEKRQRDILRSPYMIELEPEATCQLKCVGCSYGKIREIQVKNPESRRLPLALIKNVIDQVKGLDTKGIFLSGGGEPLNYPDIEELIRYAGQAIGPVFIQTNGLRLDRISKEPELFRDIRAISVSIYGADEESFYATVKRGAKTLGLLQTRIFECLKAKEQSNGDTIINAKLLIGPNNYRSIGKMIGYCESAGFDSILLREIQNIETGFEPPKDKTLTPEQRSELVSLLEPLSDRRYAREFISKVLTAREIKPAGACYTAQMGILAVIDTDGDVYVGTPEIGDRKYAIGNIHIDDFDNIWNGDRHREVISLMVDAQSGAACPLLNCRHSSAHYAIDQFRCGERADESIEDVLVVDPLGRFI